MTELPDYKRIPEPHDLKVELLPEGRKLYFQKECLEAVTILRKRNGKKWKIIAKNVRTPYTDDEPFSGPANLIYKIIFASEKSATAEVYLS